MDRDILHVCIPHFPIALARVVDHSLRERPVALAPGHSGRSIIQCVSPEAESDGVLEGMPVFRALRYCPSLILLPPDPRLEAKGNRALLDLSWHYTPLWEPSTPGRFFLDLTGSSRLLGPGRDAAARLDREIADRLSLRGSVGVAGNKMISRIASGCLHHPGVCDVLRGSEASFIAPLPVSVLPGIGLVRERTLLTDLNLHRVEELAALTVSQLGLLFGPFSRLIHQRALGIDPSPVQPPERTRDITEESFLAREDNSDEVLSAELCRLAEGCGMRLRGLRKAAGRLTLTIHYSDGMSARRSADLSPPAWRDQDLITHLSDLFSKTCTRRVRVKGLRLSCRNLADADRQLDLFAPADRRSLRRDALQEALDGIREKYDRDAIRWGTALPVGGPDQKGERLK
ncbi:MAG: DNA polymerase IV [bacterium]|nr:MAG: DNA polymerase IV [bacterium]